MKSNLAFKILYKLLCKIPKKDSKISRIYFEVKSCPLRFSLCKIPQKIPK